MQIPSQLIAGDTATWTDSLADYPADDSWVLKYRLTAIDSTGGTISLTAAASGSDHVSTITAATSAVWVPGGYSWAAWVEGAGSTVFTVEAGIVTVLANPRTAVATCSAAPWPWTGTGQTSTRLGKRSSSRWMMSRITAPVGDVTTPMTPGRNGSGRLRSLANSPSASSRRRVLSSSASSAPSPAISIDSMTIWYFERPG